MTREETAKYSEPLPDRVIRRFSMEIQASSIITSPVSPGTITPGWLEIRGIAWSGQGRVSTLMSRAIDKIGYVLPTYETLRAERGPGSPYHLNTVVGWTVGANREIHFDSKPRGQEFSSFSLYGYFE